MTGGLLNLRITQLACMESFSQGKGPYFPLLLSHRLRSVLKDPDGTKRQNIEIFKGRNSGEGKVLLN